jgi:hypothetical protein
VVFFFFLIVYRRNGLYISFSDFEYFGIFFNGYRLNLSDLDH